MKSNCKITVALVIFLVQINCNFCWIYDGSGKGFAAVPADLGNGKEKIYLEKNVITHINDDSFNETFTDFGKVYHLELSENRIENVSEKAFAGFQRLKVLNLKNNKIKIVIFKVGDIPQLEILSVGNNHLTNLPTFYGGFSSLGEMYLSGNFISHVGGNDFENITNINYIDLSNNGLVSFEPEQELLNIWTLILDDNKLTKTPTLQGTVNSVRYVELRNNQISFLDAEYFKETNFSFVYSIDLSENRIENVSETAFAGCQELETIHLDRNRIRNIIFNVVDVPKLETLDIKYNQLTLLPTFHGLFQSFRHINVAGNLILHVSADDFENITNVECINLSFNSLTAFAPRHELPYLSVLDLANNNIKEIPTLRGIYNSLQQIYLQNNNISLRSLLKLKENIHGSELRLNSLFLGGNEDFANNLTAVINFLEQFPNVINVGLSDLKISKLFSMRNVLGELDLSGNNITEIREEFFSHSKFHEYFSLTLDNNPIETLPKLYEYVKSFDSYEVAVSLKGMKLSCDDLCWMAQIG